MKKIVVVASISMAIACAFMSSNNLKSYVKSLDLITNQVEALAEGDDPGSIPPSIYDVPGRLPNPKSCTIYKVIKLDSGAEFGFYDGDKYDTVSLRAKFGLGYDFFKIDGLKNLCDGKKQDNYICHPYSCHQVTNQNYNH